MNNLKLVSLIAVAALTAPLLYFSLTPLALDGVAVTPQESCREIGEIGSPMRSNSSWKNGTLILDISETQVCGESQQSVAVQRVGTHLFIRTKYASPTGQVAACYCRQNFSLAITGLAQQDYSVAVYNFP